MMSEQLSITGTITEILDIASGVSKAGNEWKKQEFILETEGQYPKKVCFTLFNDAIDFIDGHGIGEIVTVLFNLESREFNGKWFHNVNAYNISSVGGQKQEQQSEQEYEKEPDVADNEDDDLPF